MRLMSYRYSPLTVLLKKLYRKFRPVPASPWTAGAVTDICAINLVPPEKLVEFFACCLTQLQHLKGATVGDYVEFGVFNGNSIGSMHIACKQAGLESVRLFGFDAFEGLPANAEKEDDGVWKKGFYHCSFPNMQQCLERRGINPDSIEWVKGWYSETLTPVTAERLGLHDIAIAFIDCDTYSSSKAVLDFLAPIIRAPLIMCLDDWKLNDLDIKGLGEYKAFNEFLEANPRLKATRLKSYNRKSATFLVMPA
ncbi:MAG: TylF/MycF/NovP-related O-methyltransferase [Bdellovibrionales bacterium]